MPILYACLINKRRCLVTQALGTKFQGNFGQMVLDNLDSFQQWGKQSVHLNAEKKLVYHDMKEYAHVAICDSYDIKDIEAHRFLEAFDERFMEAYNGYRHEGDLPELTAIEFDVLQAQQH